MARSNRSYRLTVGPAFSEGARQLFLRMDQRNWSQADVLRRVREKTGKNAIGLLPRWLYGDQRPGAEWARRLELATGIAAGLWGEAPKAPFTPPAAARAEALRASGDDSDRPSSTGTDG